MAALADFRYAPESGHHHGRASTRYHGCESSRVAIKVRAMADHKFKIGQSVFFSLRVSKRDEPGGIAYLVVQQLPRVDGKLQYRLRSADNRERIASERELRPVSRFSGRR
jgi:hypothetical protein